MGAEFHDLSIEEMCDLMCGAPESDFEDDNSVGDELIRLANLSNSIAEVMQMLADRVITLEKRVAELERGDDRR